MNNREVCDKIKEILSKEPEVISVFNNGSSVVGADTTESDVDFVVILKDENCKEKILKIIRNNLKIIKNEENPAIAVEEQYWVFGKRADFTLISEKAMNNKVDTFYSSKESFLELQHFMQHKIVDSVAVYDPKNLLDKWKNKVKDYPSRIFEEVYKYSTENLKENLYYWENHGFRNEFQFGFEQWGVIEKICLALYARNKRLLMLPYKRLHKDLKELKPNLEKELYFLVRGTNSKTNISKKTKMLKLIISKLEKS